MGVRDKHTYVINPQAWVETMVFYRLRGVVQVRPEGGKIKLPFAPAPAATIVFIRASKPVAMAKIKPQVVFDGPNKLYEIEYHGVQEIGGPPKARV